MKTIEGDGCATTWLVAAEYLLGQDEWEEHNLILEVRNPCARSEQENRIRKVVDDFLRTRKANPLFTVSETIFPAAEYKRFGPEGVYETYPNTIYPRIKRALGWGSYAHRMLRRTSADGKRTINPLRECIEKMKKELALSGTMRARYELSITDGAFDLPLYDPSKDGNGSRRGGPCLSHLSLKISRDKRLFVTAMYRSHYYVERTLGNLIGLTRLQAFVCEQTGLVPGPLVCVSTLAKLDTDRRWGVRAVKELIADAAKVARPRRAAA